MLPFMDKKRMVGSVIAKRGKQDTNIATEVEAPGSDMDEGLKTACEDILGAIEHKSPMDLAKALQSAFDILDSDEDEGEPDWE